MTLREKIEGLPRWIFDDASDSMSTDDRGPWLDRSEVLAAVEEWEAEQRPTMSQEEFAAMISQTASPEDIQRRRADARIILKGGGEPARLESQGPDVTAPPVGQAGGVHHANDPERRYDVRRNCIPLPPADECRPGLPAEALRKVWPEWQDSDGDLLAFDGARYRYHNWSPTLGWNEISWVGDKIFTSLAFKPHGSIWSAVEILAARALGEEDGKAGRERRSVGEVAAALGITARYVDARPWNEYVDAYAAAKGTT